MTRTRKPEYVVEPKGKDQIEEEIGEGETGKTSRRK